MNASREVTAERSSAIPLRVDHVTDGPAEPMSVVYCTDIEGTELQVVVREPSITDLPREAGEWYRFDGVVRSRSLGTHLLFPSGDSTVERIDAPERRGHPPMAERDAPWLAQLGASDNRIAVTVQPRPTGASKQIRVSDPETFEIGAICFAHCDQSGDATVYHREEPETRDEQLLLEHVVEDLSEAEGATLVTRGSNQPPLGLLYQRLTRASGGDAVAAGAEQVLHRCFHATTAGVAARAEVDTLVEAADQLDVEVDTVLLSDYDIGIDPADWREDWEIDSTSLSDVSDPQMTDRDYTALVEQYLGVENESVDSAQLARCLKAYASADLTLLRELVTHGAMDRLGCPQLSDRLFER
jgi:hypothetical protein